MSNNDFPQPPKLSSAKELMDAHKAVKPADSEAENATPASVLLTVPVVPQPEAVVAPEQVEASVTPEAVESVEAAVGQVEEALENEDSQAVNSEVDATIADTPEVDTADQPAAGKDADVVFGPWEIVKHTGIVTTTVWAVLSGLVCGATAFFFAPGHYTWIALGVLGFLMGALAAIDLKTHLIKDQHTIITAILTVPLALLAAFNLGPWNFLYGILAAVIIFLVFFALVLFVGFGSGGDIKFSPIPAFALGVINPLISAVWLFLALIVTVVLLVFRKAKKTSFGEGMVISLPLALLAVYGLYSLTGMPYMHPA